MLNIQTQSDKALEWLQDRSGICADTISGKDRSYSELMHLRHLHRVVLCEEFRKGHVARFLEIGGNSLNNSLKYHKKQLESKVYQIIYQQLKDYVYSN